MWRIDALPGLVTCLSVTACFLCVCSSGCASAAEWKDMAAFEDLLVRRLTGAKP